MSEKPSRGPWTWVDEGTPRLVDAAGNTVCSFGKDSWNEPEGGTPPNAADARLIAAAPQLLAAVKQLWGLPQSSSEVNVIGIAALLKHIEGED